MKPFNWLKTAFNGKDHDSALTHALGSLKKHHGQDPSFEQAMKDVIGAEQYYDAPKITIVEKRKPS